MDICMLSLFMLLCGLIKGCCGESSGIEVVTNPTHWRKSLCKERGKRLVSLEKDELKTDVDLHLQEQGHSGSFWVGGERQSASWMWAENGHSVNFNIRYMGCIDGQTLKASNTFTKTNSPITCISNCMTDEPDPKTIQYIALHGEHCYCLKDVAMCPLRCGNNACGGNDEFSIYGKKGKIKNINNNYQESCTRETDFSFTSTTISANNLTKCRVYCDRHRTTTFPYVLLQNNTCGCLERLPDDLKRTVFHDASFCGIHCVGSVQDKCGGFKEPKPLLSVYEIKDRVRWDTYKKSLPDLTKNCVYMYWDEYLNKSTWENADCSDEYPFICETDKGAIPIQKLKSWFQARKECISMGGDLLKHTMFKDDGNKYKKTYYWIGMHRHGWRWLDGTDVIDIEVLQTNFTMNNQCLAMNFSEDGQFEFLGKDCNLDLPYICFGNGTIFVSGKEVEGTVGNYLRIFLIASATVAICLILMICFIVICAVQQRTIDILKKRRAVYYVLEKQCEEKCDPKTCKCRHCIEQYHTRDSSTLETSFQNGGNLYESVENTQSKHSHSNRHPPNEDAFPYDRLYKKKSNNNFSDDSSEDICSQNTTKETFDHTIDNGSETDGNPYDRCAIEFTKLNPRVASPDPTYAQVQK